MSQKIAISELLENAGSINDDDLLLLSKKTSGNNYVSAKIKWSTIKNNIDVDNIGLSQCNKSIKTIVDLGGRINVGDIHDDGADTVIENTDNIPKWRKEVLKLLRQYYSSIAGTDNVSIDLRPSFVASDIYDYNGKVYVAFKLNPGPKSEFIRKQSDPTRHVTCILNVDITDSHNPIIDGVFAIKFKSESLSDSASFTFNQSLEIHSEDADDSHLCIYISPLRLNDQLPSGGLYRMRLTSSDKSFKYYYRQSDKSVLNQFIELNLDNDKYNDLSDNSGNCRMNVYMKDGDAEPTNLLFRDYMCYYPGYFYALIPQDKYYSPSNSNILVLKNDSTQRKLIYKTQFKVPLDFQDNMLYFGGYNGSVEGYVSKLPHLQVIGACNLGLVGFYGSSSINRDNLNMSSNGIKIFNPEGGCIVNTLVTSEGLKSKLPDMYKNYNKSDYSDNKYSNVNYVECEGGSVYDGKIYSTIQVATSTASSGQSKYVQYVVIEELSNDPGATDLSDYKSFNYSLSSIFNNENFYPINFISNGTTTSRQFVNIFTGELITDLFGFIKLLSNAHLSTMYVDLIAYNNNLLDDTGCLNLVNSGSLSSGGSDIPITAVAGDSDPDNLRKYEQLLLKITNNFINTSGSGTNTANNYGKAIIEVIGYGLGTPKYVEHTGTHSGRLMGTKWYFKFNPAYVVKDNDNYVFHDAMVTEIRRVDALNNGETLYPLPLNN